MYLCMGGQSDVRLPADDDAPVLSVTVLQDQPAFLLHQSASCKKYGTCRRYSSLRGLLDQVLTQLVQVT